MSELTDILAAMAAKKAGVQNPRELFLDVADRIVKHVCAGFGAKGDEVAILLLTADGKHLRFVAPRPFAELGSIPLTKRDSIAVGVFARRVGEVTNNVPMVKHVSFFETIKLRDKIVPIQKMVTTPIFFKGQPIGIVQVSRKGENSRDAGPDFTSMDVKRVQGIFEDVAPYLHAARPPDY